MRKIIKSFDCTIIASTLISIIGICLTAFLNYYFVNKADNNSRVFNYIEKYGNNYSTIIECKDKIKMSTLALTSSLYTGKNTEDSHQNLIKFKKNILACEISLTSLILTARVLQLNSSGLQCALNNLQTFNRKVSNELDIIELNTNYNNPHVSIDANLLLKFGNEWNKCLIAINNDFNAIPY